MRVCSALKDEEEKILYPPPHGLTGLPIAAFSCVSGTHESVAGTRLQQQRQQQERKLDSMLPPVWLPALSVWLAVRLMSRASEVRQQGEGRVLRRRWEERITGLTQESLETSRSKKAAAAVRTV